MKYIESEDANSIRSVKRALERILKQYCKVRKDNGLRGHWMSLEMRKLGIDFKITDCDCGINVQLLLPLKTGKRTIDYGWDGQERV